MLRLASALLLTAFVSSHAQAAPACHPDSKKLSWQVCVLDAPLASATRCVSTRELKLKGCDVGDLTAHLEASERDKPVAFYALSSTSFGGIWAFQSESAKLGCDIRVGAIRPSFLATPDERSQTPAEGLDEAVRFRLEKAKKRIFTSIIPQSATAEHCAGETVKAEVLDKSAKPRALYRAQTTFPKP